MVAMHDIPLNPGSRLNRCVATLNCREADRAPLYSPAISCGVSSAILGRPVHTGTGSLHYAEVASWAEGAAAHADFEARLVEDLAAVHRALDMDVLRMPWRMNVRPDARLDADTFRFGPESGEHTVWQYQPATADFSPIFQSPRSASPEARLRGEIARLEAAQADPMPAAREQIAPVVELWRRFGAEFLVFGAEVQIGVGLDPDNLELTATEPDLIRRKAMLQAEHAIAVGRALLEAGCPPIILGGGDLAGNLGPFYSPAVFRNLVLPAYVKALAELNRMGAHYFFRSDGDLWPLMDMLFDEAACPGYGEADRDASMTVAAVRARFPRLVIWGNVSSSLLARGTAAQVRDEARAALTEAGGKGYFQGCSNALIQGTRVENVQAMFSVR
jgi:hypothetical protein